MDPRERLRLALCTVGCSRCGQPYPEDGVSILAQRESIAFVRLECPACATQILALVTGAPAESEGIERTEWTSSGGLGPGGTGPDAGERGRRPERGHAGYRVEAPPIDELDVDEMHEFLAEYHGDLRTLLERRGPMEDR